MSADRRERTERKLMAVLVADVVGYSRLMGEDEEGTLAALKVVRCEVTDPKIEEHRGRIVKPLGDGLLVAFDSVVDAVRCAVEVQREMAVRNLELEADKRIMLRIGINLDDVIIDDADIFGDGVNVAARLEGLAEPGGICVSRAVRDRVRDKLGFGFEDMGQRRVKNINRPVHIFRVFLDSGLGDLLRSQRRSENAGARPAPPPRRGTRPKIVVAGAIAATVTLGVLAAVWSWAGGMNAAPGRDPSPVIGGPVLFEKDRVVLVRSADGTLAEQAQYLRDHPDVKAVIAASCARDEGAREDAWVLAELRANRVRDALKALRVAGNRMTTENACKSGGAAKFADEVSKAQDGRILVLKY
jgi:class 3 adenylate cyclase/outer membrane protein OmpA-like peptidoglycan-associated protein